MLDSPIAAAALGSHHLARTFWLDQARYALTYEALHGNMTDQEKLLVRAAAALLVKYRDKELAESMGQWKDYLRADGVRD